MIAARPARSVTRAAAFVAALAGCGGATCPPPSLRFVEAGGLVHHHARLLAWAENLRAEAVVDRREAGAPAERARLRGTVLMLVERPDRVRFDAMTQFGPAATLTSDGASFALMDLRENRFFAGPPCAENIALLLGVPMEAEDVGRVLVGEAPQIEAAERDVVCEGGRYRVTLRAADGSSQELSYEVREIDVGTAPLDQRLRLRETTVRNPSGAVELRIRWDDHRVVPDPRSPSPPEGVALPHRVQVELPLRGLDTLIRFGRIEINVEMPEGVFTQDVRPGLAVEPVECGD